VSFGSAGSAKDASSRGGPEAGASDQEAPIAWQPLTPRGVAAFAGAPLRRLLLLQLIVALVAAGTVVWFLHQCWFPTIGQAIHALPPNGEIRNGRLDWSGPSPVRLAEGRFLAITVDGDHTGEARSPAHLQLEFGRGEVQLRSVLAHFKAAYPTTLKLPFNQTELWPWWGAWSLAILALVAASLVAGLIVSWAIFATLYCLPVRLIGFFANRDCSLVGSWRLAGAALMPGALLLCAFVALYGSGAWDVVQFAAAAPTHLVVGWIYLILSPLRLPRHSDAVPKGNPFT
jgi:hypothetical protein